jgi:hypothetical protein
MAPEDLQPCIDLLRRAAEELAKLQREDLPTDIALRITAAHVRMESLRLTAESIQLTCGAPPATQKQPSYH